MSSTYSFVSFRNYPNVFANCVDAEQMPHSAASDPGLHLLHVCSFVAVGTNMLITLSLQDFYSRLSVIKRTDMKRAMPAVDLSVYFRCLG